MINPKFVNFSTPKTGANDNICYRFATFVQTLYRQKLGSLGYFLLLIVEVCLHYHRRHAVLTSENVQFALRKVQIRA